MVGKVTEYYSTTNFLGGLLLDPAGVELVSMWCSFRFFGSGGRDRTYDQLINSQLLYR